MNTYPRIADNCFADSESHGREIFDSMARRADEFRVGTAFFEAQMNSTIDGILVVDSRDRKIFQNQRMIDLFGIPPHIANDDDDQKQRQWVMGLAKNPERFRERISYLNAHPDETYRDELEFKNGKIFDRYSSPVIGKVGKYYGRIWTFRDITERKNAEQAAIRLAAIVESSDDAIVSENLDGIVMSWNASAERTFGYLASEMVGKSISRLIPPDRRHEQVEITAKIRRGESVQHFETVRLRKDGSTFQTSVTISPIRDSTGLIIGASKSGRDITERKKAEEQLQLLRNENGVVLNSMNEGVHWINIDGRIHFENPASARMLGYEESELLGRPAHATMHHTRADGTPHPQCDCPIHATLHDGVVRRMYDDRFWRKDGTCFPVDYTCSPIIDESGRRIGAVVVFIDVTERKKAELEAIRLAAIVESSDDAIIGKNLDGVITSWNAAAERTFGFPASEMIGQSILRLLSPECQQEEEKILSEIRRGKSMRNFETVRVRKDGALLDVSMTVSPIKDSAGVIIGASITVRDITDRKLLESELADASRQAGMAEIATGVLHNVGNVLNSVNISGNVLVEQVRTAPVAELGRVVALLREQGANLGAFFTNDSRGPKVIEFLSTLSEMFIGLQTAQFEEVAALQKNIDHIKDIVAMQQKYARMAGLTETLNVTDLVEDTLRINTANLQRDAVQVVREFEPELPDITTEKHKILQILVNLVSNARSACEQSCRVDKQITVRVANSDGRIRVQVIDNGVGIPPENLNRIFNHGFTTKKDGHGFGLHNSANAAKELGGSLAVHSDGPGHGATFTLELPVQRR